MVIRFSFLYHFCYNIVMNKNSGDNLNRLLKTILHDYFAYGPVKTGEILQIKEIKDVRDLDWSGEIPFRDSFKQLLMPPREKLFAADKSLEETRGQQPLTACLNVNVLDLKAIALFDAVFANDIYYQNRREKMLLVGYTHEWPIDYKKYRVFSHNFEENILEYVPFDIFIAKFQDGKLKFYSGSPQGRKVLDAAGISNYTNIKFAGAVSESGADKRMIINDQHANHDNRASTTRVAAPDTSHQDRLAGAVAHQVRRVRIAACGVSSMRSSSCAESLGAEMMHPMARPLSELSRSRRCSSLRCISV